MTVVFLCKKKKVFLDYFTVYLSACEDISTYLSAYLLFSGRTRTATRTEAIN